MHGADTYAIHFPHNDTLVVTMLIDNYRMSKILVDCESCINVLNGGALNRIEDTPEIA